MNYIVFDLEATCEGVNNFFQSEIIEIGAVKVNDKFEIVDEFSAFIKPVVNPILTEFCKKLTTINQADVDSADTFPTVTDNFINWIGNDDYILCSWGFYDKTQFKKDCKLHRFKDMWVNNHISLKHQHGVKVMNTDKGVGMKRALITAGLDLEGTQHRAIDDARNITKIFLKYKDIWDFDLKK